MHRSKANRRKTAFTLVELLVVIGIISVLIAMLLPALNRAREAAKTVACASNMRQVMLAIQMYANDNRGYYPGILYKGTVTNLGITNVFSMNWLDHAQTLGLLLGGLRYLPNRYQASAYMNGEFSVRALRCPADPNTYGKNPSGSTPAMCWSYDYRESTSGDPIGKASFAQPLRQGMKWPAPFNNIPQHWILIDDCGPLNVTYQDARNYAGYYIHDGSDPNYVGLENYNVQSNWHRGGTNVAYMDGHVKFVNNKTMLSKP
jgi:prepilin-type processing-associated H-X9-DG protein/prepilin-type N-terminal cleavage/methylation domain-containing protein